MWDFSDITTQVARKEYNCDASDWYINASPPDEDIDELDLTIIARARLEGFRISKGTKYLKIKGMFNGEFSTFRARLDMNNICEDYALYNDDQ